MTSTLCRSAALDYIIAPWAAKIAAFLGAIVETILTIAENIRNTLQKLGVWLPEGRIVSAGAVSPDDVKARLPAAFGEHAPSLRPQALARIRAGCHGWICGKSEARIKAPFPEPSRRLMTILVPPELNDDIGSERRTYPHVKKCTQVWPICESFSATEH